MQVYTASKGIPLKPLHNASLDIIKLPNIFSTKENTEGNHLDHRDCDVSNFSVSTRLGKCSRMKTRPRKEWSPMEENSIESHDFDSGNSDLLLEEATHLAKKRRKVDRCEIKTNPNFTDAGSISEELESFCNFRRFSSRKKKQTDFLGVQYQQMLAQNALKGRRSEQHQQGPVRRLVFPSDSETTLSRSTPLTSSENLLTEEKVATMELLSIKGVDEATSSSGSSCADTVESSNQERDECNSPPLTKGTDVPVPNQPFVKDYPIGSMVWGKLPGYNWWPGVIVSYENDGGSKREKEDDDPCSTVRVWIKWYGETQLSKILSEKLAHFHKFQEFFQPLQMKGTYRKAVFASIKEAVHRCKMEFRSSPDDKKLRWMLSDRSPLPKLISEREEIDQQEVGQDAKDVKESSDLMNETVSTAEEGNTPSVKQSKTKSQGGGRGKKGRGKGSKTIIYLTSLEQEMIEWACVGFLPAGKDGLRPVNEQQVQVRVIPLGSSVEGGKGLDGKLGLDDEPPRKREKVMLLKVRSTARFESVKEGHAKISDLCVSCGELDIVTDHPLFHGGLCLDCKNAFMETSYLFDEDGSQMYCTICSAGEQVFMCDAENCSKVYCAPCVKTLCGEAELDRVRASETWLCYMCSPDHSCVGLLEKREDWYTKLRELFMNDHEMEYEIPTFYPPLPPEERHPIRVLGLFDGIATGLVVLKELGLEVDRYVASEIDIDAVFVSRVKHKEILHVGDIERITEKEVKAWGPFDLVFGGSPCNDLSVVNPARRGIYEGTGRLFFEFYRILSYARPPPGENRPFFWLFENVVSMKPPDKQAISRFLQCNPVVVDARDISAAHRARYFWGNLPGMNRPSTPLPSDRLTLQSCLEPNCFRVAQFTKLRTITTKMNSIKQTKKAIFPVKVEGQDESDQGDVLWCTEMERLFGFPEHYTDVANLGRCGRQRLLGKAWSVPVIRHLMSPLKDYFKSETSMDTQNITSRVNC